MESSIYDEEDLSIGSEEEEEVELEKQQNEAEKISFFPPEELFEESPQVERRGKGGNELSNDEEEEEEEMETEGEEKKNELEDNEEEKVPLNDELQHGYRILCELMSDSNKAVNWPFLNPVDDSLPELEDYYDRISRPMWMKKMRLSFEKREYESINDFLADFRLMLENCYRYNGPDTYISKRGQRLETMLGQKLALLPRNLRERTNITPADRSTSSEEIAFAAGIRRRTRGAAGLDSSALLNQLREEEVIREKQARKQHMEERKAAQEAVVQEVYGWEDVLLVEPLNAQMRAMWELPQIGHFLFLCQEPLYLAEVPQYELERCFLMVRESTTMQRIMSSLLSTPHQRTKLFNHRHRMPYRVWEEKLQTKVKHWYDVLESFGGDVNKTADKLGIDPFAFDVLGRKNPLKGKKYHELGFYRKVWVMKCVCDHVMENQESLREAIEFQPPEEQKEYVLGCDAEGNVYIHFPQFCGADLRVYRHKPHPDPFLKESDDSDSDSDSEEDLPLKPKKVEETIERPTPVKKKQSSTKSQEVSSEVISAPSVRPSRLRQKIKTILPPTSAATSGEDEDYEENNDTDYIEPVVKVKKKRGRKPKYYSQSNTFDSYFSPNVRKKKKKSNFRQPTYLTQTKFLKTVKKHKAAKKRALEAYKRKEETEKTTSKSDQENNDLCNYKNDNVLTDNKLSNGIKQESKDCDKCGNSVASCSCDESKNNLDIKTEGISKHDHSDEEGSDELLKTKSDDLKKETDVSPSDETMDETEIKSRSSSDKNSESSVKEEKTNLGSDSTEQNESRNKDDSSVVLCKTEKEEPAEPDMLPEVGNFELIVDSVQDLRDLIERIESESPPVQNTKGRKQKTKQPPRKRCVIDLLARLNYLLNELEPWEQKLIQANQKARRKMKREQESFKEETPKKELRTRNNQSGSTSVNRNADSSQKTDQGVRRSARNPPRNRSAPDSCKSTLTPLKPETPSEEEFPDVSSRGRLRKRRIIPNNVENEMNAKKRRSPLKVEEVVNTPTNKKVTPSRSKRNNEATPTCSSTINLQNSMLSANLKQTSYPVIHQLLSNGQGALDAAAQTEIKLVSPSKTCLHSQTIRTVLTTKANVVKQSKPTSTAAAAATTINLSPKLITQQSVTGQVGTGGKIQYYTQLSNLTPQLIQQLLRNATVTKSEGDDKGRRTFVLSSAALNRPNNIVSPNPNAEQEDKSKKSTILISSTPVANPSGTFTPSSTVITSAGTNVGGGKTVFQNSNIHTVLPQQFQVLLRTSDPSALIAASSPKTCKNQARITTQPLQGPKPQQGPVYVISNKGVTPHILGAGAKLTTGLPIKTGQPTQIVQNTSGSIIPSTPSASIVNAAVPPSSVSHCKVDSLGDNSIPLIQAAGVGSLLQSQVVDPQLSKNNLARSPGKYACNVTVKSLLENRVIKMTTDEITENVLVTNGLTVPINQPVSAGGTSSIVNNSFINLLPTLSSSVNDAAHVAKNTCLLNTVQSQFPGVKTNQPAAAAVANLNIPSSIMLPSVQPSKSITQTIQSNKIAITISPTVMSTGVSAMGSAALTPSQANLLQSLPSSAGNVRVNIPQQTLINQPPLMSLKQPAGRSVTFLQSGTSVPGSKNVILKVMPQNLINATTLGTEPSSSNIVINVPKAGGVGGGQVNIPATRKITHNELKQLGTLPQHILTTVNPSATRAQTTTVQSVISPKSLPTPGLGLQMAASGIPLTMQKSNNQNILLLSPKDQNLQQQQNKPIGVIPVPDQKRVSTVQQIQGLSGQTLQIIPSQGNTTGLNNILQGQLLQSKNGNIILTHSAAPVSSTGNISQLLHSSLNNHLTVTNLNPDIQSSVNNASPANIQTTNVTPQNSTNQLKTFKTILSNTGASIKLKNDTGTPLQSGTTNLQIHNNNLSEGIRFDGSSVNNLITAALSSGQSVIPSNFTFSTIETKPVTSAVPSSCPISMVSPLVQPKLRSSVMSPQIATNTTQCITQYSALPTSNKARTASIPQPVSIAMTNLSNPTTLTIPAAQPPPTQLHQNVSFLSSSSSSHQPSPITPQQMISPLQGMVSTNSILVATSTPPSSQPVSVVPATTSITDMSKNIKLSPQNIQTNLSQIKVLGQQVQTPIKNKQSLLQQKLSPTPPTTTNIQHTKLQTLVTQKPATVSQPQTILSNNIVNIGQTNTQTNIGGVPQLVLYSIGGQLVTQQGIPVTLENGVLKILAPSQPVATQNQVMFVQSPNAPAVGSSPQIQTMSTPYSDLLKNIKPSSSSSSSSGTILLSNSSQSTTSVQSTINVPSQMTYAVPAQGILPPTATDLHQQYSPKVIPNLENHVLLSSTQAPVLESAVSAAQPPKVAAANIHNKTFLVTSPSTMVNKDIGGTTVKQQAISTNVTDMYLNKPQTILSSNTKSGTTMVLMDANNLQTKHSVFYPVTMADTQALAKPVVGNVLTTHAVDKSQLGAPQQKPSDKTTDSFESAAILLSLAGQSTASSSSNVDIDPSVVSFSDLVNHTQAE